jgi:hypothetical protein
MSTVPIIDDGLPATWEGQLGPLVERCRNVATQADARSALDRMAALAELCAPDYHAEDALHENVTQLLGTALAAHLDGGRGAYTVLLYIARLADRQELRG